MTRDSRSSPTRHSNLFCLLLILLGAGRVLMAQTQQNVLIFPQLVSGADYISTVTLVNTNFSTSVTGTLSVFNQDGTPRSIAVDGRGTASTFSITIPAGGTAVLTTSPGGGLTVGMARFASDFPAGGVVRFQFTGGQVGVLNAPIQSFATLVLNTADGNDTGVAITNPGTTSINLRLAHSDDAGRVVETVDPPELNPLPANAQVSKFVTQFGFTQVANRSSGSIQIQTKGAGAFASFALLLRQGMLSSTAVVPGVTGKLGAEQFPGSYTGPWNNTTFGSSGTATLNLGVIPSTRTGLARLSLTGVVFGVSNPPATLISGTYDSNNNFTGTGDSTLFGPITMTISSDGTWTFTANSVPGTIVSTFRITGTARPDKFSGDFVVGLRSGGTAAGTIALNHTGQ